MPEQRIRTPFRDGTQIFSRFDADPSFKITTVPDDDTVRRLKQERDKTDALIAVCDTPEAVAFQKILNDHINDLALSTYELVMCSPPDYVREQNIGYLRGLTDAKDVRSVLKARYDNLSARIKELGR